MMRKCSRTYVYCKPGEFSKLHKGKPLNLFVTIYYGEGDGERMQIRGSENPLPFREIIIKECTVDFNKWLLNKGWEFVGCHMNN